MPEAHAVTLTVNGTTYTREIQPTLLLVEFLRETLGLTGTHVGCDTSQCGACTVRVDGLATKACTMLAVQAEGADVLTVEGLAKSAGAGAPRREAEREATLHPIQNAFAKEHGLQCGFCTPGLMMTAVDFLERNASPSDAEIRHAIEGNLCRCTGYHNIVNAIRTASVEMRQSTAGAQPKVAAEVKR
jgi:aerobic carbon-monoxide dehydrogenase small subunit